MQCCHVDRYFPIKACRLRNADPIKRLENYNDDILTKTPYFQSYGLVLRLAPFEPRRNAFRPLKSASPTTTTS